MDLPAEVRRHTRRKAKNMGMPPRHRSLCSEGTSYLSLVGRTETAHVKRIQVGSSEQLLCYQFVKSSGSQSGAVLPLTGHSETSGDIPGCHDQGLLLASSGQRRLGMLLIKRAGQSSTTKDRLHQTVSSTCSEQSDTCFSTTSLPHLSFSVCVLLSSILVPANTEHLSVGRRTERDRSGYGHTSVRINTTGDTT